MSAAVGSVGFADPVTRRTDDPISPPLFFARNLSYSPSMHISLHNTQAAYPLPCVFRAEGRRNDMR
jgi:hypothetical protein